MARIGVVNVPFYSHTEAAARLSRVLVDQGHEVVAWAAPRFTRVIERSGAEFVAHDPNMPVAAVSFVAFVACLSDMLEAHTETLIEQMFERDLDLVIHDSQVPWARIAGLYLGLPRLVTHPMWPHVDNKRIPSDKDPEGIVIDSEEAVERVNDAWERIGRRWGIELGGWPTIVHSSWAPDAKNIGFTTPDLLGPSPLRETWALVGPLLEDIRRVPQNGHRPLIYASYGTSFNRRRGQFTSIIEGLADLPVDVAISLGKGPMGQGYIEIEELGALPPNVEVHDYLNGREMLTRADIHVTHAGCNSVHESLLAGVPMVCMPQAYDQFPLAWRVSGLGAGTVVEESAEQMHDAILWLLEDPAPRERARELGEELRNYDGAGAVAKLIGEMLES